MSEQNENKNPNFNSDKDKAHKFLNDIYDDFFYLFSSNPEKLEELRNTMEAVEQKNVPISKTEPLENTEKTENVEKAEKIVENNQKEQLKKIYTRIENSHLTAESQLVLKKMISYAQKFSSGMTKKYIPFNMRIYCDNNETLYSIVNIIIDGFKLFNYIKNDEAIERSFFVIEEPRHISDLYNNQNSILIFNDVDGLLNKEKASRDKLLSIWENEITDYSNFYGITTIITDKTKDKVDEALSSNTSLKDKIFDFELFTERADSHEVYLSILNQLKKDYIVSAEFELKLLDYVTETYNKTTLPAPEYSTSVIEKILFNQTDDVIKAEYIPKYEKDKSIAEIFQELNSLVGLDNIKLMLKDLVNLNEFKKKTDGDINLKSTNLHMVFLGNPGTGKTTVARIVAGILYNLGFIKQNKLIEVSAKDLIGQYVGQTAPKTLSVIEKALDGVLFIDEAYSLASTSKNDSSFNAECIATLIQAMENNRDKLVVIFAGYSKEMDAFLKSNSGIVSRIGYTMEFKDYTLDELITILLSMFEKTGFIVDDSAIEKSKEIITQFMGTPSFGNARFVRNLYEKAIIKHATNTENQTDRKILKTITADDITSENLGKLD